MKQLIIFDLDGTLLNTIDDLGNATNFALRKMGFTSHPLAAYNYMVGNGVRKLMERAAPDASPETVDELLKYFREYYDQHSIDFTRPYPGIQEMIAIMQANNMRLAVTSNKYQAAVDRIINHFFPESSRWCSAKFRNVRKNRILLSCSRPCLNAPLPNATCSTAAIQPSTSRLPAAPASNR